MSAICGVFHLDGHQGARGEIAVMSAALAHRGPDGDGVWSDDVVGLAHRMLVTTQESVSEVQPVVRSHPPIVLVADARIDNRHEILAAIDIPLGSLASDSDIIAAAYQRWGQGCVDHLIGDFAFAIWNAHERSLFCARDPMGVKPFYYFQNSRVFAFASELKSLLTLADVTPTIDPEEVALFLGWVHEDRTRTMYRDVKRLAAAHTMLVTRDRSHARQYWHAGAAPDVRFGCDDDYADAFRDIFSRAVDARLRSALPIGATLSGGLDSSSIVCMSRQLRGANATPLHTFSVVFPDLPERELRVIDERSFVDAVAQNGGIERHYVRGDELSPLRDLRRMLWHLDEPFFAPNLYLHWGMFEAANDSGVRVLLDGFDGDSVVSHGLGRLTGLARSRQWDALEAEVLAVSAHHGKSPQVALDEYVMPHLAELARGGRCVAWCQAASEISHRFGSSFLKLAVRHGLKPMLPSMLRENRATPEGALIQPAVAASLRRQNKMATDDSDTVRSEHEAHLQGLSQPVYQLTLELADKSAAAFGVEPRYPFFDCRLIEFCLGLPEEQKFAGGWPRLLLRRAMAGILPPVVQWRRSKSSLSPNFHRRFRAIDLPLAEAMEDTNLSPYVRRDRLRSLLSRYRGAGEQVAMKPEALALFRTTVLGTWLNQLTDHSNRGRASATALSTAAA